MEDRTASLELFSFQARLKISKIEGVLCLQRRQYVYSSSSSKGDTIRIQSNIL